jgi:hypothetical protein
MNLVEEVRPPFIEVRRASMFGWESRVAREERHYVRSAGHTIPNFTVRNVAPERWCWWQSLTRKGALRKARRYLRQQEAERQRLAATERIPT